MKKTLTIAAAVLVASCMTACGALQPVTENVQRGVDRYCSELPQAVRLANREAINPTPDGNSVEVRCGRDPAPRE